MKTTHKADSWDLVHPDKKEEDIEHPDHKTLKLVSISSDKSLSLSVCMGVVLIGEVAHECLSFSLQETSLKLQFPLETS